MTWRVISSEALHFCAWGDEFIVYNSLSGDTHLIDAAAAHVLSRLQEAPYKTAILAESLAPLLHADFDEELVSETEHLLADLVRLELVEHC